MNYQESKDYLTRLSAGGSVLGLTTMELLLNRLGNPQDELQFIHVAGTNGKGSVLAYLAEILKNQGYSVGRYISPVLFHYREKIQINGEYIGRDDFARITSKVAEVRSRMEEEGLPLPTVFEVETAISFLYFKEKKCDYVLLEVGMGGRTDATNIIKTPVATLIASVSMDHMQFLGNTLREIAWNKAGIFKEHVPAASAHQQIEAEEVIREEAKEKHTQCQFVEPEQIRVLKTSLTSQIFSYKEFENLEIHLMGAHQLENAALALEAVKLLREQGITISDTSVREGLKNTIWKGRFTIIHEDPYVVIDGAHNPDAAMRLRTAMETYFPDQKKIYIFGVFSDKEYDKIIEITAPLAEYIYTVETPDNPRALPAEELAKEVAKVNAAVEPAMSIADAVKRSLNRAGKDDVIMVFGSLSFLKEVEACLR